ncbi:hypothetical protein [Salinibacterium sp. SWN1162]|uniref:hypothetical protein n=1 Tax=Salinibacterium sp. SWN1162 TaxID=2792053 RepID=UPI0018CEEE68|nr:hypothetical protein [Salinibacterium sp. SWN1162]MBH0008741.1 hypothetical protein [Salinibacterium sp. SWN1162]
MAALQAATPATLLAHDSRTLELARYHSVPFQEYRGGSVDIGKAYEEADLDALNQRLPDTFLAALEKTIHRLEAKTKELKKRLAK